MSLRLDVGVLDHLLPFAELDLDVIAAFARRRGKALKADILEFRLNVRAVDDGTQRGVELGSDGRRRSGRRDKPRPGVEVEALDAGLIHGGRSGNSGLRFRRVMASERAWPADTCGMATVKSANIMETRPAITSSMAGGELLLGTRTRFIPAQSANVFARKEAP